MKIILSLLLLLITSCSIAIERNIVVYNDVEIEKEFIPHVKTFEKACGKKVKISIKFSKRIFYPAELFDKTTIGICIYPSAPFFISRQIYIEPTWWDEWNEVGSLGEELILHELGHCILNRGHDRKMANLVEIYERPKSIMYPNIFGYWGWYEQNKEEYLRELCQEK